MIRSDYENGLSISEISRRTGHDRKTVRKYVQQKDFVKHQPRPERPSKLDPYKDYIKSRLKLHPLSAVRILEEIRELGFDGGYTIVKDFTRELKHTTLICAEYRYETKPGFQMQVDWCEFGHIEIDGIRTKLYCFVAILGYSRTRYAEFTLNCKTETFIQCHLNAFDYFGGITKEILYDNTKNVVLKRALVSSKSIWNPLFEDFFRHFGFMPRLCRPGEKGAKTKGKVERSVYYLEDNFFLGRHFESFQDINNQCCQWLKKINLKPNGTTHEIPIERLKHEKLDAIDKISPYQICRKEYRKIARDCYFQYMGNRYSVPWKYANHQAELHIQNDKMKVIVNGENICEHICREGPNHIVRDPYHFDGLLKQIRERNMIMHQERILTFKTPVPEVETRPLVEYDIFCGGDGNEQ